MRTYTPKANDITRKCYVIDATNLPLGRLASKVAFVLRGKHKPQFTPYTDTGDFVIVINAKDVRVTGAKTKDKKYYRHSGFPGGIKETSFEKMIQKDARRVIEIAVKGMLPKNPLGRQMYRKLRVYANADHLHQAQQPEVLTLD